MPSKRSKKTQTAKKRKTGAKKATGTVKQTRKAATRKKVNTKKKGSSGKKKTAKKKVATKKKVAVGKKKAAKKKVATKKKVAVGKKKAAKKKTSAGKKRPTSKKKAAARKKPAKSVRPAALSRTRQGPKGIPPIPVTPPQPKWAPGPAHSAYQKALKLLHGKKFRPAQKALLTILKNYPEVTEVTARVQGLLKVCERALGTQETKAVRSPEELFNMAVFHHNRGELEEALETFALALKGARDRTDHILYAMAASELSLGNTEEALNHLEKSVKLNPDNRFFAQNDSDFESLASNARFQELINPE